ncbi:MAG: TIGR00153 family protein [Alphaproteobacteria bacterium]|nr:MAG: TIGR00153 family protein [Alphaproteobacteria bacterium]
MVTTNPLLKLFGQSPFGPLQEHMRVVVRCADMVPGLFEALCEGDEKKIHQIRDEIFALENKADGIKNELRSHLPKTLFMPVDRRDILEILDLQDSIADTAQDIAGALMVRRPKVLDSIRSPLLELTDRCLQACHQMARIMEQLDELVETGFRGRGSETVLTMINELNQIETDTDRKAIDLLKELFAHENEIDPVSLMVWHRLIRWVGDLADYAEKVGNRLRLLIAHS